MTIIDKLTEDLNKDAEIIGLDALQSIGRWILLRKTGQNTYEAIKRYESGRECQQAAIDNGMYMYDTETKEIEL